MLKALSAFFEECLSAPADAPLPPEKIKLAGFSLLFEISRADQAIDAAERDAIAVMMEADPDIDSAQLQEMMALAEREARESTSMYEFTRLINDHYSDEQKFTLITHLWRVAFADGVLDKHEEHLIRRMADLLHVPHVRFIEAKHRAQQ